MFIKCTVYERDLSVSNDIQHREMHTTELYNLQLHKQTKTEVV